MDPTNPSLLRRLVQGGPQAPEWAEFLGLYRDWILGWLHRNVTGLGSDADDLAQEVYIKLVHALPEFERKHEGHFRNWLRRLMANCMYEYLRARKKIMRPALQEELERQAAQLKDPSSELSQQMEDAYQEDRLQFLHKLMNAIKGDFEPHTWRAFELRVLEQKPYSDIVGILKQEFALDLKLPALRKAVSRVWQRLEQEAEDWGLKLNLS